MDDKRPMGDRPICGTTASLTDIEEMMNVGTMQVNEIEHSEMPRKPKYRGSAYLVIFGHTILAVCAGGLGYSVWLIIFLLLPTNVSAAIENVLWMLAPVLTTSGFSLGVWIRNKRTKQVHIPLTSSLLWTLIACSLGALTVYWYGPMLIVFSMLACGTLSVLVHEIISFNKLYDQ